MADLSEETKQHLHNQLVKLGDMMGDGMHREPGGKWIERDYQKVLVALGYKKPVKKQVKKRNPKHIEDINEHMEQRTSVVCCKICSGELKQTRSGSMRAKCVKCGAKFQLIRVTKKKKHN